MLVVLNFHAGDAALATAALESSARLGRQSTPLLLASPIKPPDMLLLAASQAFQCVSHYNYTDRSGPWPSPQNHAWQSVARHLEATSLEKHWLWWEPDAVPLAPDWASTLATAAQRTAFAGALVQQPALPPYMNGVGIWPTATTQWLANTHALYTCTSPFDIAAERMVMRSFTDLSHLIIHEVKAKGGAGGRHFEAADLAALRKQHPEAMLYHGCTDGSLHALVGATPHAPPAPASKPPTKKPLAPHKAVH